MCERESVKYKVDINGEKRERELDKEEPKKVCFHLLISHEEHSDILLDLFHKRRAQLDSATLNRI